MSRMLLSAVALVALAAPALADSLQPKATPELTDISAAQKRTTTAVTRTTTRTTTVRTVQPRNNTAVRTFNRTTTINRAVVTPRVNTAIKPAIGPAFKPAVGARIVTPAVGARLVGPTARIAVGPGRVIPAVAGPVRIAGPVLRLNNGVFSPIYRGQRRIFWRNSWRIFLPFAAIGVVAYAGSYWYPDGYVSVARPYCSGVTPDGCRLDWRMVPFEGGGEDWQCVQFCPRQGQPAPAQTVAFSAPPAAAGPADAGQCQITIYSEPQFSSNAVPTGEDQPQLSASGWQNQIASIQVASGTWDVFTDENYQGQTMRLAPGEYPQLGPEWTKKIGSFMCLKN